MAGHQKDQVNASSSSPGSGIALSNRGGVLEVLLNDTASFVLPMLPDDRRYGAASNGTFTSPKGPQNQIEPRLLPNLAEGQSNQDHQESLLSPFTPRVVGQLLGLYQRR